MKRSEIIFGLLRIPIDVLMVLLAFRWGYQLRLRGDFIPNLHFEISPEQLMPEDQFFEFSLIFASLLIVVFGAFKLYQLKNTQRALGEARQVIFAFPVWALVVMSYFFVVREVFFSRLVLGFSLIISLLLILAGRWALKWLQTRLLQLGVGQRRVLLIGNNKISDRLLRELRKDPHYKVVGQLRQLKNLKKKVFSTRAEQLIQTSQELSHLEDHEILEFCQEHHLDYRFVPDILEVERSNIEITPMAGYPLIHLKPTSLDGWGRLLKRIVDILGSSVGLVLLSPLFALIALGIKLDSKGPVFFCRLPDGSPAQRVGQGGAPFTFYKFRSMVDGAHNQRDQVAEHSHRKGPLMKVKNDPRVTRFGRFLRRTSLDELPNLWNVLRGDMSLVGPRPHLPEEVERYETHHKFLLTIKPGITGLGQTSGRSDLDFEEEVRLETYYIKHWSLRFDLKILLKTIVVVLSGKAAD